MIKRLRRYFCNIVLWQHKDERGIKTVVESERRRHFFYLRQAAFVRDYGEFPQNWLNNSFALPDYHTERWAALAHARKHGYRYSYLGSVLKAWRG
jgi:hypothetical protein